MSHTAAVPAFGVTPPGYRLPPDTHVGRVRLQVSDLGRSVDYYTTVLGLAVLERGRGRAALGSTGARAEPLIELRERPGATPPPRMRRLGLYHFALLLPSRKDLGAFLQHLIAHRARPGMADHFVSEALYLYDPDGLGIEVYADRPPRVWRANADELVMVADPLDVDGVLASAGRDPWQGVPPGSRMGHVHLHVGDLAQAEAFYHRALGFTKTTWTFHGALFLAAGTYHHHLGTNTWAAGAPSAGEDEARLLEWELVLPTSTDASNAARSMEAAGHAAERDGRTWVVRDPWGTAMRLRGQGH